MQLLLLPRALRVRVQLRAIVVLVVASVALTCDAMDNTLAITPPMGWSSWNAYGGHQVRKANT